jgi:outer membrane lipoprotein-sorting protein
VKRVIIILSIAVFVFTGINLWAISDTDLLKRADDLVSYFDVDFSAKYTIVQDKPGKERSVTISDVFRRDSKETYVIIVLKPDINYGQGYLKQGETLWFYDPSSKRFNTTSSHERFQNTNASNSDFTRSTLARDYRVVSGENAELGKFKCRLLNLQAVTKGMQYPKMKIWISEDGLVRKTEDYSLSGQLLRTTAIPDYYQFGRRFVPKQILFVDALLGGTVNGKFVNEKTLITIDGIAFTKLDDFTYSKSYLEWRSQ